MKGFAENTYFYWQRRLRETARTQLESGQASLLVSGFVEVSLSPSREASVTQDQAGQLHVELKGIRLSADSGYPPEQLAALLQALSGPC